MASQMVRKQVYLGAAQNRKLQRLAARRGCTEAEIIREALDKLPEPDHSGVVAKLTAAGVIVPPPLDPAVEVPRGAELRALEEEFERWSREHATPAGDDGDEVMRDREEAELRLP